MKLRPSLSLSRARAQVRGPELVPGAAAASDDAIDACLREHLESAYHPCGTCRMGDPATDARAVADARGAVRGTARLRVVDASLFPEIPNGNLNAPTIMTAEKLADAILGARAPPPPPAAEEYWVDPEWRTRQRERPPVARGAP